MCLVNGDIHNLSRKIGFLEFIGFLGVIGLYLRDQKFRFKVL
jgi:hypothetical protein